MKAWPLVIAISVVVGCGAPAPVYGTVARKIHKPAWTEIRLVREGKDSRVETIHHPPQWQFVVQMEETTNEEGQRLLFTTEAEYNRLEVGRVWYRSDAMIEK